MGFAKPKGHSITDTEIADFIRIPGTLTSTTLPIRPPVNDANAAGLLVWTSDAGMFVWTGSSWIPIGNSTPGVSSFASPDGSLTVLAGAGPAVTAIVNLSNVTTGKLALSLIGSGTSTGSGALVLQTSPSLITPNLGTPSAANLANATALPLATAVSGILAIGNGGNGSAAPGLVAGTNITLTGAWPNQIISASGGGGSTGYTPAVTAGTTAAAGTNVTNIQAALNAQGVVNIPTPGVIWVNATLILYSFTRVILGPNTILRMVSGSNVSLWKLSSEVAFSAGGATAVTLTQGTGNAVNVAWTAHGFTVNQLAWISGANQSGYNGVWRIPAIVDANNFTIYTQKFQATAPTGTTVGLAAVQGLSLIGGQHDYNYPNNSGVSPLDSVGIRFVGCGDCYLEDVYVLNCSKYAFNFNATHNVRGKNLKWSNPHSDGIKVYGPSRSVFLEGCAGVTGDDYISVQTRESSAFATNQLVYGDIFDIHISGITGVPQSVGNGIHLYPSDTEDFDMVFIEDMNTQWAGVVIGTVSGSGYTVGQMGKIVFKKINCTTASTSGTNILLTQAFTIDDLTFEDVDFNPGSTVSTGANSLISSSGTLGSVKKLTFNRIRSSGIASSGSMNICFFAGTYTFNQVTFRDCECVSAAAAGGIVLAVFAGTATLGSVLFDNCYGDANSKYLCNLNTTPAGTPVIKFQNCRWLGNGFLAAGTGTGNITVKLNGNEVNAPSLGVVRTANTGNTSIFSDGTNTGLTAATLFITTGGTPTVTLFGDDLPFDVSAATVLQSVTGQYAISTTAGTNKQGNAIKVNTGSTNTWYAQGTGTGGVNTLIL